MSDKVKPHAELIKVLGGASVVARELEQMTGKHCDRLTVVKWKARDSIAWNWRGAVARLASKKRKTRFLPEGFLVEEAA